MVEGTPVCLPSFRGNTKAKISNVLPEINVTDEEKDIMKLSVLGSAHLAPSELLGQDGSLRTVLEVEEREGSGGRGGRGGMPSSPSWFHASASHQHNKVGQETLLKAQDQKQDFRSRKDSSLQLLVQVRAPASRDPPGLIPSTIINHGKVIPCPPLVS